MKGWEEAADGWLPAGPLAAAHVPKMLRSTGSRSSTWVVNTATAATQMSKDRARPYRALCTPAGERKGSSAGLHGQGAHNLPSPHSLKVTGVNQWAQSQLAGKAIDLSAPPFLHL